MCDLFLSGYVHVCDRGECGSLLDRQVGNSTSLTSITLHIFDQHLQESKLTALSLMIVGMCVTSCSVLRDGVALTIMIHAQGRCSYPHSPAIFECNQSMGSVWNMQLRNTHAHTILLRVLEIEFLYLFNLLIYCTYWSIFFVKWTFQKETSPIGLKSDNARFDCKKSPICRLS